MTQKGQQKSILIVVREAALRGLIQEAIGTIAMNAFVVEAADGLEADMKIQNQTFDLVIMDVDLPRRDGSQLLLGFREIDFRKRPGAVLLVSGDRLERVWEAGFSLADIYYTPRPNTLHGIKARIERILMNPQERATRKLGAEFLAAFAEAAANVFAVTTATQVEKHAMFIREEELISGDVSAILSLQGENLRGSMAITFSENSFLYVAGKMFGEKVTEITAENSDVAGEVCNQILGLAKQRLSAGGFQIRPAFSSIVTGKAHQIRHVVLGPVFATTFSCAGGIFTLETSVVREAAAPPA